MSEPFKITPASTKTLTKEIATTQPFAVGAFGFNITPKEDVVLQYLAMSDEREYEKLIRTDPAISGAIEQRICGLMDAGSAVVEGPSHSAKAAQLKAFAIHVLKGIPKLQTLRRELLDTIYYGWRPVELQWGEVQFEGRTYWGIHRAVARRPWHYHFTDEGHLARTTTTEPEVYSSPADKLRYVTLSAGSTESPYGKSALQRIWLLYFLSKQFEKMGSQAMQRALGILKAVRKAGGSGLNSAAATEASLNSELTAVLAKLNAYNILQETAGYSLEVLPVPEMANNITKLFDYFNTQKRIAIVGQNLTSEVQGGSFAAEQGHGDILATFIKADAREEADWWNDGILRPILLQNFGAIDEADLPRWMPKVLTRPNMAATQFYYETGGTLDGKRIADEFNIPALFEVTPEDVPLKKQATGNLLPFPADDGGPGDEDDGEGVKPKSGQPAAPAGGQDVEVVPELTLNGAQIQAASDIVKQVADGLIPRDSGIGQLEVLLNLSKQQAEKIMGTVGTSFVQEGPPAGVQAPPFEPRSMRAFAKYATADAASKAADSAAAKAGAEVSSETARYYSAIAKAWLEENPDPKG